MNCHICVVQLSQSSQAKTPAKNQMLTLSNTLGMDWAEILHDYSLGGKD